MTGPLSLSSNSQHFPSERWREQRRVQPTCFDPRPCLHYPPCQRQTETRCDCKLRLRHAHHLEERSPPSQREGLAMAMVMTMTRRLYLWGLSEGNSSSNNWRFGAATNPRKERGRGDECTTEIHGREMMFGATLFYFWGDPPEVNKNQPT